MKCEYCDSYLSAVPASGVCPNCGGLFTKEKCCDAPVGVYTNTGKTMEISHTDICFHNWNIVTNQTEAIRRIPFGEVTKVVFLPGDVLTSGMLCVRGWEDRDKPIPKTLMEKVRDRETLVFSIQENQRFLQVFDFLKQWADKNRAKEKSCNEM